MQKELDRLFKKFDELTALVIGDVMIDAYYWGKVERISPEAPVPVVQIQKRENRLGGAANVALNVKSLGAKAIICSVVGNRDDSDSFRTILSENSFSTEGIVMSDERITTVKTRIISQGQHLLRVDEEETNPLSAKDEKHFIEVILNVFNNQKIDVVIFEDYNKGTLTERVIETVIDAALAKGIPITVDPKKDNFFTYKNVTLFKPNLKELREGLLIDLDKGDKEALKQAMSDLQNRLNCKMAMVTLSELGIMIKTENEIVHEPAHDRKILDVSGAGDTVISVASLSLAADANPHTMTFLSNLAGGLVCEKIGVVSIDKNLLFKEANHIITNK